MRYSYGTSDTSDTQVIQLFQVMQVDERICDPTFELFLSLQCLLGIDRLAIFVHNRLEPAHMRLVSSSSKELLLQYPTKEIHLV